MLAGTPIAQLILFLLSLALKQRHTPQMPPRISRLYWLAILAIPCGTLLLVLIICREYERLGGIVILLISCILLALNLLTFYVLDRLEEYSAAYYEKELLTRQNRAYRAEFNLMRQSERQASALRHDMKNHLAVLREYAAQGKMQELERYLDAFDQKLIRPGLVHTGPGTNRMPKEIRIYILRQWRSSCFSARRLRWQSWSGQSRRPIPRNTARTRKPRPRRGQTQSASCPCRRC